MLITDRISWTISPSMLTQSVDTSAVSDRLSALNVSTGSGDTNLGVSQGERMLSRRKARSSMGTRVSRRQNTKRGTTVVVEGRKVKMRRPKPRSKIGRILRGEKV